MGALGIKHSFSFHIRPYSRVRNTRGSPGHWQKLSSENKSVCERAGGQAVSLGEGSPGDTSPPEAAPAPPGKPLAACSAALRERKGMPPAANVLTRHRFYSPAPLPFHLRKAIIAQKSCTRLRRACRPGERSHRLPRQRGPFASSQPGAEPSPELTSGRQGSTRLTGTWTLPSVFSDCWQGTGNAGKGAINLLTWITNKSPPQVCLSFLQLSGAFSVLKLLTLTQKQHKTQGSCRVNEDFFLPVISQVLSWVAKHHKSLQHSFQTLSSICTMTCQESI